MYHLILTALVQNHSCDSLKEPSQTTNIQGYFKIMITFKYTLKVFRNNFTQVRGSIKKNLNIFVTFTKSGIVKSLF